MNVAGRLMTAFEQTMVLILRSREAASRRMAASGLSWFETAQERLLTMRVRN
jgi:hypothetical protein